MNDGPHLGGQRAKKRQPGKLKVICFCVGASEASSLEIPTLTCTCVVATFFYFLLTLFIRKLRQVRGNKLLFQPISSILHICKQVQMYVLIQKTGFNCQSVLFLS